MACIQTACPNEAWFIIHDYTVRIALFCPNHCVHMDISYCIYTLLVLLFFIALHTTRARDCISIWQRDCHSTQQKMNQQNAFAYVCHDMPILYGASVCSIAFFHLRRTRLEVIDNRTVELNSAQTAWTKQDMHQVFWGMTWFLYVFRFGLRCFWMRSNKVCHMFRLHDTSWCDHAMLPGRGPVDLRPSRCRAGSIWFYALCFWHCSPRRPPPVALVPCNALTCTLTLTYLHHGSGTREWRSSLT